MDTIYHSFLFQMMLSWSLWMNSSWITDDRKCEESEWKSLHSKQFLLESPELVPSFWRHQIFLLGSFWRQQILAKCHHLSRKRLLNCPPSCTFYKIHQRERVSDFMLLGNRNAFSTLQLIYQQEYTCIFLVSNQKHELVDRFTSSVTVLEEVGHPFHTVLSNL